MKNTIITPEGLHQAVNSKDNVVVLWTSGWSEPSRRMSEKMSNCIGFFEMDIDSEEGMQLVQDENIKRLPTIDLYKNGKLLKRIQNELTQDELKTEILDFICYS